MSKSSPIETILANLAALKLAPRSPEAAKEVRAALSNKNDYVVERAAEFVREFKLPDFAPDLARAFHRFASSGDHGFSARTALASALCEMKGDTPDVYLAGLRMVGTPSADGVDPASPLRGICAMALVRIGHRAAMIAATDLLADTHTPARLGAIRALALSCENAAALVLRLKLHLGDEKAEVIGECLTALMHLDPGNSVTLVGQYLSHPIEWIAESAALALGESRRPEALKLLREQYEHTPGPEARKPLLLAIAITRLPDAAPFLVTQVENADLKTAEHALEALHIYRLDEGIKHKIREAVEKRATNAPLRGQFEKHFA